MRTHQIRLGIFLISLFGCGAAEPEDDGVGQAVTPVTIPELLYEIRSVNSGKCVAVECRQPDQPGGPG